MPKNNFNALQIVFFKSSDFDLIIIRTINFNEHNCSVNIFKELFHKIRRKHEFFLKIFSIPRIKGYAKRLAKYDENLQKKRVHFIKQIICRIFHIVL